MNLFEIIIFPLGILAIYSGWHAIKSKKVLLKFGEVKGVMAVVAGWVFMSFGIIVVGGILASFFKVI